MSLDGRVAIVTGASRGIGEYVSQHLARAGAKVAVAARTVEVTDPRLPGTIHSVVEGNTSSNNSGDGIQGSKSVFSNNIANNNTQDGIDCSECTVTGNGAIGNTQFGLRAGSATAYGGNRFGGNNGGDGNPQVSSGGIELSPNVCGGDPICP